MVERVTLGSIDALDVKLLLSCSNTKIPQEDHEHAVRVIQAETNGNTLAAVFSVAEAEACATLSALEARLSERRLHSGVHEYYTVIWRSALHDSPVGLGAYLSFVLCILRERIAGEMMQEAFSCWNKAAPEWNAILKNLEPLVVCDSDGYRVRHNDIRVFLEQELRTDETSMQNVASLMADYYMGPSATPFFRQVSLFNLLQLAGREIDKARVFEPKWVLNAAAYGQDISEIYQEAEEAFRVIPDVRDWDIALSVACGGMTLAKLSECFDAFPDLRDHISMPLSPLPQCLETERYVLPFSQWDFTTIRQVLDDARMLSDRGETNRARGIMEHWFRGVLPAKVVANVNGIINACDFRNGFGMDREVESLFEDWGTLVFRLGIAITNEVSTEDIQHEATYFFEKGWVSECISVSEPDSVLPALRDFNPRYLGTFEVVIENAASKTMWEVVAKLFDHFKGERDRLSLEFRVKAAYWVLKAIGQDGAKEWLEVISEVRLGEWKKTRIEMPLMIFVAKSIGWTEPHREASAIASELGQVIAEHNRHLRDRTLLFLSLEAAAMIGKAERLLSEGDTKAAITLLPASAIQRVIELIWKHRHSIDFHEYSVQALDLTFELIELCYDIGDIHGEMVLSLAMSETEKFPVDQRMPVLWEVLRRDGRRDRLLAWAEHWIGQDGAAWSGLDYSERAQIVGELLRLCRDEGWIDLVEMAEDRLRHHLIGYLSHKEYSFQEPFDWVKELFSGDPATWQEEGIQLLNICQECDDQGGDNRFGSEIENEVAATAFRCGPDNAYAFFNWIDPEVERYWIQTVRSTIITAGKRAIADQVITECIDLQVVWCCAVGLTRWFNKYQAQTMTALRDTILGVADPDSLRNFACQLQTLTPGEFLREEYDKEQRSSGSSEDGDTLMLSNGNLTHVVSELAGKVEEGAEPSIMVIGLLAMRVAKEDPTNRTELMEILFGLVDANRKYATGWDYWGQSHPLRELIPSIREDEIWCLMRATVRTTGDTYWLLSVPHNVHLICLYQAAAEGVDHLRRGTQYMFGMHRLWSGVSERQATIKKDWWSGLGIETWSGFVANVLCRLLSSDSAETVSAALRGLCAVAEIAPKAVYSLFDNCDGVQRSRLLLGAEVWAVRHPHHFTDVIEDMWNHRSKLSLRDRIQLWICRLVVGRTKGSFDLSKTFIPETSTESCGHNSNLIMTKQRRLLEIGPEMQGSVPFANAFSAARNWVSRFENITSRDTDDLEASIAEGLDAQDCESARVSSGDRNKRFATENGDVTITRGLDSILDRALEDELRKPGWSDRDAGDVAMAVTHGDDPWILRRSPLPSPTSFEWPDQEEVDEWLDTNVDNTNVLNRLRLLARGGDLGANQQVIGSYLRLFTSRYDFEMWYWLEAIPPEEVIKARKAPFCPSGRSFQFFLPERFEPHALDRAPLVFFSRSILCLSFSTLEIVPSRVLQDQLGWKPKPQNPLKWTKEGHEVAKYEYYHGPLDYNWSRRHMRQPTMSRWVVNAEELNDMRCLSPVWDYQTYQFSDE